MMEIRVTIEDIARVDADAIVVTLFERVKQPAGTAASVDKAVKGLLTLSSVAAK
jgi:biotin synthase-related radical SAM superfamily protein